MSTKDVYKELAGILNEYDPNLLVLKSLREGENDPDVISDVDVYCLINQKFVQNTHVTQGPVSYGDVSEGHGIRVFQNKRITVQFDFYGKDEYEAEDKAISCNAFLCERLVASPTKYSFSLLGYDGDVENTSSLAYGKRYKFRYSFRLELLYVHPLDISCRCEKMPEKLIIQNEVIAK